MHTMALLPGHNFHPLSKLRPLNFQFSYECIFLFIAGMSR